MTKNILINKKSVMRNLSASYECFSGRGISDNVLRLSDAGNQVTSAHKSTTASKRTNDEDLYFSPVSENRMLYVAAANLVNFKNNYMNTKFRKKPVVIDAFQVRKNNLKALETFVGSFGDSYEKNFQFIDGGADGASLKVNTLEGTSYEVQPNDWIIRGVNGEYYPCKPDIFGKTYEPA